MCLISGCIFQSRNPCTESPVGNGLQFCPGRGERVDQVKLALGRKALEGELHPVKAVEGEEQGLQERLEGRGPEVVALVEVIHDLHNVLSHNRI